MGDRLHSIPKALSGFFAFVLIASTLSISLTAFLPTGTAYAASPGSYLSKEACSAAGYTWKEAAGRAACVFSAVASDHSLDWQIRSMIYFRAIGSCMAISALHDDASTLNQGNRITPSNAGSGRWFIDRTINITGAPTQQYVDVGPYLKGAGLDDDDMIVRPGCGNAKMITNALSLWGWKADELLCASGFSRTNQSDAAKKVNQCTDIKGGSGDFERTGQAIDSLTAFKKAVLSKTYGGTLPNYDDASYKPFWYAFYQRVFQYSSCGYNEDGSGGPNQQLKSNYDPKNDSSDIYKLNLVGEGGTSRDDGETYWLGGDTRGTPIITRMGSIDNARTVDKKCGEIEVIINTLAPAYKEAILANTDLVNNTDVTEATADPSGGTTQTSSCTIGGMGWIICPAVSFLGDMLSGAFKGLSDGFLVTDPQLLNTNSGTYIAWGIFRSFANVAFVIAFLIIIFSQLTGLGVTNYGVKKLLPRIIIAAVLVNLSYFICQAAVDLSNVLGYGLNGVFNGIASTAAVSTSTEASAEGFGVGPIVLTVLAGGAAAVAWLAIGTLIPVVLGAVVSVLMIVLILIARKALIIILIMLSPLAFVAFLLPNTEPLFTKWRKAFVALLMLFPIISVVFGASSLVSQLLVKTAPDSTEMKIIGLGVAALPFFVVPSLLKGALDGIGGIGAKLNGFASKAGGALGRAGSKAYGNSRTAQRREFKSNRRAVNRALTQAGAYKGKNRLRQAVSDGNKRWNASKVSGKFGDSLAAKGVSLAAESENKEVGNAATLYKSRLASGEMTDAQLDSEQRAAHRSGDRVKTKAIQNVRYAQGGSGVDKFGKILAEEQRSAKTASASGASNYEKSFQAMRENIADNHGQMLKGKSVSQAKLAGGGTRDEKVSDIETYAMSASDLKGQTGTELQMAADAGSINPETALKILTDKILSNDLDDDQRAALQQASGFSQDQSAPERARIVAEKKAAYDDSRQAQKTQKAKTAQDAAYQTYVNAGSAPAAGEKWLETANQEAALATYETPYDASEDTKNDVPPTPDGGAAESVLKVPRSTTADSNTPLTATSPKPGPGLSTPPGYTASSPVDTGGDISGPGVTIDHEQSIPTEEVQNKTNEAAASTNYYGGPIDSRPEWDRARAPEIADVVAVDNNNRTSRPDGTTLTPQEAQAVYDNQDQIREGLANRGEPKQPADPITPLPNADTTTQKAIENGVYRINSTGSPILPSGSRATNMRAVEEARKQNPSMDSAELKQFLRDNEYRAGNTGSQLSEANKKAIDARVDGIIADFEARERYKELHPGATDAEIQNAGDGVFGNTTNNQ